MKGDFSRWDNNRNRNYAGVLHQQGRVLLDTDWNDQTRITNDRQDTAARDIIGPGVVAVPIHQRHAFEVGQAEVKDGTLYATLSAGHAWVDGLLVYLPNEKQFQVLDSTSTEPKNGSHAVVLEVWREEVNGFQEQDTLIEPALGGPDTTERVHTAMALRLQAGQGCEHARGLLGNRIRSQGLLTVKLDPTTISGADCPVVEGGGYTGFEHHLYRIEIAQTEDPSKAMFKWSRFNGGLVGRGQCGMSGDRLIITIHANMPAIQGSGLNSFYLEILKKDTDDGGKGHWRVTYGAKADLDGDRLVVQDEGISYQEAGAFAGDVFFRLWDGIEEVESFEHPGTKALRDGIRLKFDPNGASSSSSAYCPGDYWTFKLRAGQNNPHILLRKEQPHGISYHRAPLAIIHWKNGKLLESIQDCRRLFRPLTNQKACCSFLVGDGKTSHGDFDSIQEAIEHLPLLGGEITLLPGIHQANAVIKAQFNITIKGCGLRTLVIPAKDDQPIFLIKNSGYIRLENLTMGSWNGTAIRLDAAKFGALQRVTIQGNHIFAFEHAIQADRGSHIHIRDNIIRMFDKSKTGGGVAIFLLAMDSLIERNNIGVLPVSAVQDAAGDGDIEPGDVECVPLFDVLAAGVPAFLNAVLRFSFDPWLLFEPFRAEGGIQIGSGSERIEVLQNRIFGGAGNGITLGSDIDIQSEGDSLFIQNTINLDQKIFFYKVEFIQKTDTPTLILLLYQNGLFERPIITKADGTSKSQSVSFLGSCQVFLLDPGYRITDIKSHPIYEMDTEHTIYVDRAETEVFPNIFAFIHDINIEQNEIIKMGLSGIGTPQRNLAELLAIVQSGDYLSNPLILALLKNYGAAAVFLVLIALKFGVLSGFAVNLTIRKNTIMHCLQNPLLSSSAWPRGEGGISLGFCENLGIQDNRVEENGRSHTQPVTGVFISYAGQAEISRNKVLNNGPLDASALDSLQQLQPGIRGGIIVRQATSITKLQNTATAARSGGSTAARIQAFAQMSGYAARIHDNIVRQPVGQALRIFSAGPVSVANNHFNVDFSAFSKWDKLAGMVCIQNVGLSLSSGSFLNNGITGSRAKSISVSHRINVLPVSGLLRRDTIFCDNQMRLGMAVESKTALLIRSADALSYTNNWSEIVAEISDLVEGAPEILLAHAVLWAQAVTALGNQHAEPTLKKKGAQRFSLVTHGGILNTTANNQGVHCIILSAAGKKVGTGNLSVEFESEVCDKISLDPEMIKTYLFI